MNIIKRLKHQWHSKTAALSESIRALEKELQVSLPSEYKELLAWSNGGEGQVGRYYLSLWAVEEVVQLNRDYEVPNYLPGIIGIGTDGGGELYSLDYRQGDHKPGFIRVPLGDLEPESVLSLGDTFLEWLDKSLPLS